MFARSQQISSPLLLPLIGSIVTTSVILSVCLSLPTKPTLNMQQLLLRVALDLTIAACIHLVTVWTIWRLVREYIEPGVGSLVIHIWAAVAWLPLIATLGAERSLWISCIVPWACSNAIVFLNLWSATPENDEPEVFASPLLFEVPQVRPLWRSLLPYAITVVTAQAGLVFLVAGHLWSAASLFSACLLLLFVRHPLVTATSRNRRRFSRSAILQTALVFFLLTTALTPFLQKAYGLRFMAKLLAAVPASTPQIRQAHASDSAYFGVVLTLPPQPHPRIEPPTRADHVNFSRALVKPVVIPFDGVYWYFKAPDTRPGPGARIQRGDPIQANVRSTDRLALSMEAHQSLASPISTDCCHALRVDLLNGDDRLGVMHIEVTLRDTSGAMHRSLFLGSLPVRSSELQHIPLNRPPVHESLRFEIPTTAHGSRFDEIQVVIRPSSERELAGSKVAIQNFVLVP